MLTTILTIMPVVQANQISLGEAVDNTDVEWVSPNDRFYGQTNMYYHDGDAAECSDTGGNLKATVYGSHGTFRFYWRTTCDFEGDGWEIIFWIRYRNSDTISGSEESLTANDYEYCDTGWLQHEFTLTETADYEFIWMFSDFNGGSDTGANIRAWVDKVEWTGGSSGNTPPIAVAGGPYNGEVGESISFDGSGSYDTDGSIVSYQWDFGDGNTGSSETTSHIYSASGQYTLKLTVIDDGGKSDSDSCKVTINEDQDSAPNKPNGISGATSGKVGETLHFYTSATHPKNNDMLFGWDWGSDDAVEWTGPYTSGETVHTTHEWSSPGIFYIKVKAKDATNNIESEWADPLRIEITKPDQPEPEHYAVIICGGYGSDDDAQIYFDGSVDIAEETFRNLGYKGNHLIKLRHKSKYELKEGVFADLANKDNIGKLFIYFACHGGEDSNEDIFLGLNRDADGIESHLYPFELESWMKDIDCLEYCTIVIDSCHSGAFLYPLSDEPDEINRIVITSVGEDEVGDTCGTNILGFHWDESTVFARGFFAWLYNPLFQTKGSYGAAYEAAYQFSNEVKQKGNPWNNLGLPLIRSTGIDANKAYPGYTENDGTGPESKSSRLNLIQMISARLPILMMLLNRLLQI